MSSKIVVAGVTSLYMAVGVDDLPERLAPVSAPAWMRAGVTGAAGHIAQSLTALGDDVRLCTVTGEDLAGEVIRGQLRERGLLGEGVIEGASSLGIVLVASDGSRRGYPYLAAVGADLAVLTNARFVQPLLAHAGRLDVPVAVDVHLISDLSDAYNRPWLELADVVFCSHERLPCPPAEWIAGVFGRYPGCEIAAVGRGADGCLLGLRDGTLAEVGAVAPRGVVSTAGAGDALFGSFLHSWLATGNPVEALESAVLYAGWKIGDSLPGAALLTEADLDRLRAAHPVRAVIGRWYPAATQRRSRSVAPAAREAWPHEQRRAG